MVVEAEAFVLKGPDGKKRGEFSVDRKGRTCFTLADSQGRTRLNLTCAEDNVGIAVSDKQGIVRMDIGEFPDGQAAIMISPPRRDTENPALVIGQNGPGTASAIAFGDSSGQQRLTLGLFEDGRAGLDMRNPDQKGLIQISVRPGDVSQFSVTGAKGKAGMSLNAFPDGSAGLLVRDSAGKQRITNALGADGRADLTLRNGKEAEQVALTNMPDGRSVIYVKDSAGEGAIRLEGRPDGSFFMAMENDANAAPFFAAGRIGREPPGLVLRGKDGRPYFVAPPGDQPMQDLK